MTAPAALTTEQLGVLARAVSRAPSVHNSQPWQLLVRGTEVDLLERRDVALRRHDPSGRDRLLSCGAAATNLQLAVRAPAVVGVELDPVGAVADLAAHHARHLLDARGLLRALGRIERVARARRLSYQLHADRAAMIAHERDCLPSMHSAINPVSTLPGAHSTTRRTRCRGGRSAP